MQRFVGKSVYGAIAVGKVSVLERRETKIRRTQITDATRELERVELAKQMAKRELRRIYERALREVGQTGAQIFDIHMMMLDDEDYNDAITEMIKTQGVNAEYAVSIVSENFSSMFAAMDDAYMQARAADVRDISARLIDCMLCDTKPELSATSPVVICADDLTPSETVLLDKSKILAFVTSHGSASSHTAILAKSMNIPAIIGVGEELMATVSDGDSIAVDGFTGEVFLHPDRQTLLTMEQKQKDNLEKIKLLRSLKGKENVTLDGTKINIYANIGGVDDIGAVLANDAGGIGLFRSEFLYLERDDYPSEEHQLEAYKKVLVSMAGKRVIIRTLDIGADKRVGYFGLSDEENPALGLRAIRLCLAKPHIFKTQLRALFRASAFGRLGIMFPMIASVWELDEILAMCDEVKAELDAEKLPYSKDIEIGIMIETPAAALISERLAPLVDFFSIGTNDLTQYTLACDRQNPHLDSFCDPHHEAVLRLIEMSAKNAHAHGAWIGICGELASDTALTETFLRMGIDELSVSPSYVLKLRNTVRNIRL